MLRVMPEASHASAVRRGESRLGRPDLYLLQWALRMGLQGALGLKVDCVSTEQLHDTPEKKGVCVDVQTHTDASSFLSFIHTTKKQQQLCTRVWTQRPHVDV